MYAVVEFDKKQCSLVPLCWTFENQTKCYWPRVSDDEAFNEMVIKKIAPKNSWSKHKLLNVLYITDDYQDGLAHLQKKIDELSSEADTDGRTTEETKYPTTKRDINSSDVYPLPKRTTLNDGTKDDNVIQEEESQPTAKIHIISSVLVPRKAKLDDDSNIQEEAQLTAKRHINGPAMVSKLPKLNNYNRGEDGTSIQNLQFSSDSLATTATRTVSSVSNGSIEPNSNESPQSNFEILALKRLEQIVVTLGQHSILLNDIRRNQKTLNVNNLTPPEVMPTLPISKKNEYRAFENFLAEETNFQYMKQRLAAIGGSNVRNCTMNMLKFCLTNEYAMKFNWAGRDKRPFKKTLMNKVIHEAIIFAFSGRSAVDLSDKEIKTAIQDWLKLAKARHQYRSSKSLD